MTSSATTMPKLDRYVVVHVATTCDEHGVYVTKDSAEVIEIGWILLDSKTCDEVGQAYFCCEKSGADDAFLDPSRQCLGQASEHPHHTAL